jgi:hypothetical protein
MSLPKESQNPARPETVEAVEVPPNRIEMHVVAVGYTSTNRMEMDGFYFYMLHTYCATGLLRRI